MTDRSGAPAGATPVRNAPSPLPTTLRFMASRLGHRLRGAGEPAVTADLEARVAPVVAALAPRGAVVGRFDVKAGGDWVDTGIDLAAGEPVCLLADGMVWLARGLDVGFGAQVGLWYRVGDAPLRKALGPLAWIDTGSGGRLRLTTKPPGEFASVDGRFEPGLTRKPLKGGFSVIVIRWPAEPGPLLDEAARLEPGLFGPLKASFDERPPTPAGWHYLWRLGEGRIFSGGGRIGPLCCDTRADVGILQFPVDLPLAADTVLNWRWRVHQLPSRIAEHTAPTHDYLSIAVEFDNGLDLTYMWSATLAVGTIFQCPLPWWDERETHWVVRSGEAELGRWLDESRPLLDDYRRAIGGDVPTRIVGIWLIANTAFQRGRGRCEYDAIRLEGAGRETSIG